MVEAHRVTYPWQHQAEGAFGSVTNIAIEDCIRGGKRTIESVETGKTAECKRHHVATVTGIVRVLHASISVWYAICNSQVAIVILSTLCNSCNSLLQNVQSLTLSHIH